MPSHRTSRLVAHSARAMFDLVADVGAYPQFVPLCEALRVRSRKPLDDGREMILTDMTVGYKVFHDSFTSAVTLDPAGLAITVSYVDGPFSRLVNNWRFVDVAAGGSRVEFAIEWEMKSRMLALAAGAVFERAFGTFAEAFEARADKVYGKAGTTPHG